MKEKRDVEEILKEISEEDEGSTLHVDYMRISIGVDSKRSLSETIKDVSGDTITLENNFKIGREKQYYVFRNGRQVGSVQDVEMR